MPDAPTGTDTLSVYRAGVTWLVGLSSAAVGGAFLNFDKVAIAPWPIRLIFFLAALAFGISVACGIQYFFWLNYTGNQIEKRTEIDNVLASATAPQAKKDGATADRPAVVHEIQKAWHEIESWHWRTGRAFDVGMGAAGLLLLAGVIWGAPPKTETGAAGIQNFLMNPSELQSTNPYEVVQSAMHATRHGREAHTFLLDRKMGAIWQMRCKKDSDVVEFHRVHRYDFDGKAEDPKP
jgi:hypothetical protein